jgi:hypothetical protein
MRDQGKIKSFEELAHGALPPAALIDCGVVAERSRGIRARVAERYTQPT